MVARRNVASDRSAGDSLTHDSADSMSAMAGPLVEVATATKCPWRRVSSSFTVPDVHQSPATYDLGWRGPLIPGTLRYAPNAITFRATTRITPGLLKFAF